jgi:MFS transporter, PAT family, solute carrier family 33 (acetyl-CoA transportor), member 1
MPERRKKTFFNSPFLLRDAASLSAVGAFSTAAWPYAAKLAWSPIVDATTLAVPLPRKEFVFRLFGPLFLFLSRLFGKSSSRKSSPSSSSSSKRSPSTSTSRAAKGSKDEEGEEGNDSFFYLFADSPRKSWIVPVQLLTSALLLSLGPTAARAVSTGDVRTATLFFFGLVLLAATQDIAVDGWALTLLSRDRVGWASTCQTAGTNLGFFASFTALLALGDPGFCARWVFRNRREKQVVGGLFSSSSALLARAWRVVGFASSSRTTTTTAAAPPPPALWSLRGYLLFWGWAYLAVTLFVAVCVPEKKTEEDGGEKERGAAMTRTKATTNENENENGGSRAKPSNPLSEIAPAYRRLADVMRLPAVQQLCLLLLTCRLAVLPAEAAAALSLSEKGVPRQALAGLVLLQLPAEALAAFLAGRAASGGGSDSKKKKGASIAWVRGYWLRLAAALATTALVVSQPAFCPPPSSHSSSSSSSCLTPARFSALALAGLLTAFSATLQFTCMGAVFAGVADPKFGGSDLTLLNSVANLGITLPRGLVLFLVDSLGLGAVSTVAVLLGVVAGLCWYARELPRLEALPTSAWRARERREEEDKETEKRK